MFEQSRFHSWKQQQQSIYILTILGCALRAPIRGATTTEHTVCSLSEQPAVALLSPLSLIHWMEAITVVLPRSRQHPCSHRWDCSGASEFRSCLGIQGQYEFRFGGVSATNSTRNLDGHCALHAPLGDQCCECKQGLPACPIAVFEVAISLSF